MESAVRSVLVPNRLSAWEGKSMSLILFVFRRESTSESLHLKKVSSVDCQAS